MGRQRKTAQQFKINPSSTRARKGLECLEEMTAFMACMTKNSFANTEERCAMERRALTSCASLAARKPRVVNTLNYHLQRISRLMK